MSLANEFAPLAWAMIGAFLAIVAVAAAFLRFAAAVKLERDSVRPEMPSSKDREPAVAEVRRIEAVKVLLDDMKAVVAMRAADEKGLDGKAAQLLALVGGGAGIAAVVGSKASNDLVVTPLLAAGLLCLAVVILSCVRVLAPRTRSRGSMKRYMTPEFLDRYDSDVQLTYELVKRYQHMARLYGWLTAVKGAYYFAGTFAFVMGISALVANALIPPVSARGVVVPTKPTVSAPRVP
jgi:hypothetical protein